MHKEIKKDEFRSNKREKEELGWKGQREMKGRRGQTSVEQVVLLALSFVIFTIVLFVASDQLANTSKVQTREKTIAVLERVKNAINEVYLQGAGARQTVLVDFPTEVEKDSFKIINNSLTVKLYGSDFSVKLDVPISGELPSGTYYLEIISEGNSVSLGVPSLTVSPSFLVFSFCYSQNIQSAQSSLIFTNQKNFSLNINLTKNWTHSPTANISLSNTSLIIPPGESRDVTVTATLAANTTGLFSGKIVATSENYSRDIPISIDSKICGVSPVSYLLIATYKDENYSIESSNFTFPPNATITTGNWPPNSYITIKIFDPNAQLVYQNTTQTNSSGIYSFVWPIVGALGNYTISVNSSSTFVNTTFSLVSCT